MNKTTNIFQKVLPSVINLLLIIFLTFTISIILSITTLLYIQILFVVIALIYDLAIAIFNKNRCIGMILVNTYWKEEYPLKQRIVYAILYSLSYATVAFYIFFPFDLLVFNLLFLQLPFVLLKKTTFHGYLSGNMVTEIRIPQTFQK